MKFSAIFPSIAALILSGSALSLHGANPASKTEISRWESQAKRVTIIRDDWGIAHVHGKTDADAVFGMEYAQAEDDFNRVETNYLNSLGRLAEAEGESKIYLDLRQKLFMDPMELKNQYTQSPAWLQGLMNAFADGLNFYLYKHPQVKPRVINHFEPWMALSFTEGSIGGDIERVNLPALEAFYGKKPVVQNAALELEEELHREPSGSNGVAISPSNTVNHHALLLINPHTSFFFRSELQMSSDEGLNAYGASTWGQFFIYQGFNEHIGWMHTSSNVDAIDEYLETTINKDGKYFYKYGAEERPFKTREIAIPYKTATGTADKKFTVYFSQHGPITHDVNGKWVAISLMQKPIEALEQSYLRTKATDYKSYWKTMELFANSSNNTILADKDGDIAYFHGNYIPRRDTKFDWTKPVDGSDPSTDYEGLLKIEETPRLLNPHSGWLYNSNNWPWSAAGPDSPKREDYPIYVEQGSESARGMHALRVLSNKQDFTVDSLITAAYDSYLPWFEHTIPSLIAEWDKEHPDNEPELNEAINTLRHWDTRWSVDSIPTSLAVYWGEEVRRQAMRERNGEAVVNGQYVATRLAPEKLVAAFRISTKRLTTDFGTWKTPWGEINRFQRLTGDIVQPFNDAGPSIPVGFTSSTWGSLASFGARQYPGTKKWYGTSGNSFVAVVEFGDKVRARAVTAGGESGDPSNPHFNDEAQRYSTGNLRDVYYYPADIKAHSKKEYHPGS